MIVTRTVEGAVSMAASVMFNGRIVGYTTDRARAVRVTKQEADRIAEYYRTHLHGGTIAFVDVDAIAELVGAA